MKILCIPFYLMPYNNGYTKLTDKNIWYKFKDNFKFIEQNKLNKSGFIGVSTFTILKNQENKYFVYLNPNDKNKYSLNAANNFTITEEQVQDNALINNTYDLLKDNLYSYIKVSNLKHIGFLKNILTFENHISIVFYGIVKSQKRKRKFYDWFSLPQLVYDYENFDDLSKHYIDYLVKEASNQ